MEIVEYKISRYGDNPRHGAVLKDGRQWLCTKDNVVDYVLDGIMFTNKKYIRNIQDVELAGLDVMLSQIIPLKYTQFQNDKEYISNLILDDYHEFFLHIMALGQLIEIGLDKNNAVYVGTICCVHDKSFMVDLIDTNANYDEKARIPFDKVRYIKLDTDYLNSLEIFIKNRALYDKRNLDINY